MPDAKRPVHEPILPPHRDGPEQQWMTAVRAQQSAVVHDAAVRSEPKRPQPAAVVAGR